MGRLQISLEEENKVKGRRSLWPERNTGRKFKSSLGRHLQSCQEDLHSEAPHL